MSLSTSCPGSPALEQATAETAKGAGPVIAQLKSVIFEALAKTSIAEIHIDYDTDGDDGELQAHPFTCKDENQNDAAFPEMTLSEPLLLAGKQPSDPNTTLADAIFALVYLLLEDAFCAWRGEDGSFGTVSILRASRAIEITHTRRYLNHETASRAF
jgi:hypothetical protein